MPHIIHFIISENSPESIENIKSILSNHTKVEIIDTYNERYCKKSKTISVFSPKGGVGKSMLAANLAIAIKKITKESVALLDLDMQFGDISLFMNSSSERTLHDIIKNIDFLDSQQLEEFLVEHESGVKILTAPNENQYKEKVSKQTIAKILSLFEENYKYIMIDTSSDFNEMNLEVLENSYKILLITTLELTSVKDTMMMLKMMDSFDYPKNKTDIIINRYEKDSGISIEEMKKIIGERNIYIIPENKNCVIQSINSGQPIIMDTKKVDIYKSIMKIGESVSRSEIKVILERWKEFNDRDKKATKF